MTSNRSVQIPLKGSGLFATVDEADAEFIGRFTWQLASIDGRQYAVTVVGGEAWLMNDIVAARAVVNGVMPATDRDVATAERFLLALLDGEV